MIFSRTNKTRESTTDLTRNCAVVMAESTGRCALPRRIHGFDSTAIQIFHGLSLLSRSFTRLRSCNSTHVSHVPLSNSIPYLEAAYQHAEPWFENCLPHTKSTFSCTTHRQDTQHHHTRKLGTQHFRCHFKSHFFKHSTDWLALFLRFLFTLLLSLFKTTKTTTLSSHI